MIYITVNLAGIQGQTLVYNLTSGGLSFQATAGDASKNIEEKDYAFTMDFYKEVKPELSSSKLTSRSFFLVLRKKDKGREYWPRLTREKERNAFIKTDFSKVS